MKKPVQKQMTGNRNLPEETIAVKAKLA